MTSARSPSGSMLLSSKLRRDLLDTSLAAMDVSGGDASSNLMSHTLALVERLQVRLRSSLRLHVQTQIYHLIAMMTVTTTTTTRDSTHGQKLLTAI